MDSQLPLRSVAPKRRAGAAWLAAALVFPALAAPAQAQQPVVQRETGGVEAHETPDAGSPSTEPVPGSATELSEPGATFVIGSVAQLRPDGKAAIPLGVPERVRSLISQYNRIIGKRYRWGGGHGPSTSTPTTARGLSATASSRPGS
jgi:cell wall-associated NlpC family hydrolase